MKIIILITSKLETKQYKKDKFFNKDTVSF
jgi:hypothetical protein